MQKLWQNYNLGIVLLCLFVLSWVGQFAFQAVEVANESMQHGQVFSWAEFWPRFGSATLENWQSEFLQLFSMVVLTSFLIHKGSAESKDSNDEMKEALARIEQKLEQTER